MKGLESSIDIDEEIMAVIRFVHSIETMQRHLELTLEIFRSNSKDEVEHIKQQENYKLIRESYAKINAKEDVAVIPVRHMLLVVHDRMLIPVVKLIKKLFTVDKYGDHQLKRNHHNHAKVRILVRFWIFADDSNSPFRLTDLKLLIFTSLLWLDLIKMISFANQNLAKFGKMFMKSLPLR